VGEQRIERLTEDGERAHLDRRGFRESPSRGAVCRTGVIFPMPLFPRDLANTG
jgi:hypothetical protein